jgi:drug/metabolite transporter (DMT)-like permease
MGALWMLAAGLLFAGMGVFVKLGAAHFSSAELVFYRSVFGLVALWFVLGRASAALATPHWRGHLWRGLTGLASLATYFHVITELPLATAVTLNYTSPLFLAIVTTWLLREHLHWPLASAVAVGFLGIALLLRPTLHADQLGIGLLGLASGFFACMAYINVRELGRRGEPDWRVVFYFTLICTVLTGLWMLAQGFHALTPQNIPLLLGLGLTATLAQLALTRAYRTGKTLVVGSLSYSTVVFSSLFGMLIWGELLSPQAWAGVGLVVLAGVISLRAAPRKIEAGTE